MADRINVQTASASDRQARAASEPESLRHEIAQLRDLNGDELRLRWRNLFGRAAPTHLPEYLLLRIIAYRMQANAYGDLGKNACRTLGRLASKDAGEGASEALGRLCPADPSGLRAGTLLMREWGGVLHHVTVVDEGFIWNGVTYPSLSKIAHAITGTRWNGPRFFGLRVKQAKTRLATIARDRTHTGNGP